MRVIGSGFGRTGTLSTKFALERLGFGPCHHMEEVVRHPKQGRFWTRIARGETVDWREVFADYQSCVDFPASVRWEEILAAFPDAKVLHTVRDPDRWYDSTAETIFRTSELIPRWMHRIPPAAAPIEVSRRMCWDGLFDGRFLDRDHAIEVYESWTRHVIDTVPADQLLVFEVAQGWEPLCAFLGVEVPDEPFPNVNDKASMKRRLRALQAVGYAVPVAAAVGGAGLARRLTRR